MSVVVCLFILSFLFLTTCSVLSSFHFFFLGIYFLRLSAQTSAEADSDSGCGPTYEWERVSATGGGVIDIPVLGFGTYVVSLKATDSVGNKAEIISQTASVKTKTTSPPRSLSREATAPTNLTLSWEDPEFESIDGVTYIVQFSTSPAFPDDPRSLEDAQTIEKIHGTSVVVPLSSLSKEQGSSGEIRKLQSTLLVARVRRAGATDWSLPSEPWVTSAECVDVQWLDTLSSPTNPSNWTCQPCPEGAYCVGDITWSGVRGRFGYVTPRSLVFLLL